VATKLKKKISAKVFGTNLVTAWGGPYKGTVTDIPANEWRSYLANPDHPGAIIYKN
jgi:hypothetical protein